MARFTWDLSNATAQQVTGMLKATGTNDRDVLFSAKEEFRAAYAAQRVSGLGLLIVGALSCVTVLLIPIGAPVAAFGWWLWKKGLRNLEIVESAYALYVGRPDPATGRIAAAG